jgi:hypothetical protein
MYVAPPHLPDEIASGGGGRIAAVAGKPVEPSQKVAAVPIRTHRKTPAYVVWVIPRGVGYVPLPLLFRGRVYR